MPAGRRFLKKKVAKKKLETMPHLCTNSFDGVDDENFDGGFEASMARRETALAGGAPDYNGDPAAIQRLALVSMSLKDNLMNNTPDGGDVREGGFRPESEVPRRGLLLAQKGFGKAAFPGVEPFAGTVEKVVRPGLELGRLSRGGVVELG